jgi:tyrosine-protein kinase Etk/Wzc
MTTPQNNTPYFPANGSSPMNFRILWQRRRFTVRLGLYCAVFALAVYLVSPWKATYQAMLRIEPELSTTGELTSIEAEMDILQSWATVSEAVRRMHRTVTVIPHHSNLRLHLSYYLSSLFSFGETDDFVNYQPYIRLAYFDSPHLEKYAGKKFLLEVGENDSYTLIAPDGTSLGEGIVGKSFSAAFPENDQQMLRVLINKINANPGARFSIVPQPFDSYTKNVQTLLKVERKGFRERSGLMTVELSHTDPAFAQQMLDALVNTYIATAYDRSSLGKIRALEKLQGNSVALKNQLEDAQKALANFKDANQVVDLTQDQDTKYRRRLAVQDELRKAKAQLGLGSASLTDSHPSIIALRKQIVTLEKELQQIEEALNAIPQIQGKQSALENNIEIAKKMLDENTALLAKLYSEVETITGYASLISLNQLQVISPVLRGISVIILGFGIGAFIAFAWLLRYMSPAFTRIRYDEDLMAISTLPIVARLPFRWSGTGWLWYQKRSSGAATSTVEWQKMAAREIQKMEQAIPFLLPDINNPILLFTSINDHEGIDFCATEMAKCSASQYHTLLVDAHVLQPSLHKLFDMPPLPGLSDALIGKIPIRDAIQETDNPNLFFLPAGTQTHNFRLISDKERMRQAMDILVGMFDRIVVKFPPINHGICHEGVLECADATFIIVRRDTLTQKVDSTLRSCNIDALKAAFLILNKG